METVHVIRAPQTGTKGAVARRSLNLSVDRNYVIKALKSFILSHADGHVAEIWISGFGKIKETNATPCSGRVGVRALSLELALGSNSLYCVRSIHPRNCKYSYGQEKRMDRTGCVFADWHHLLPLRVNLLQQYCNLTWTAQQSHSLCLRPDGSW
ncbi:uncharacterized protein M421DRAFT_270730 [Didymella exigua CBS 183.55]|uniref:Uncharacterized protein n=1 Tax=Didymella exigua CBS 183.55 TaxID=1150837 RepID=A0A6A5RBX9_9PLEO|nr:uncharacterized protein M421DRAFT_270730 [Didymella exigua CBS 183.55]KAF1924780.1 hypothetical protein M421DRAFT_270730 [Didymella exigua CBS 183.55]